jgi:hypothetical protein
MILPKNNCLGNEINIMTYLQLSPLYPLKGRIAVNFSRNKLVTITPLRGQGVSRCDNKSFSSFNAFAKIFSQKSNGLKEFYLLCISKYF